MYGIDYAEMLIYTKKGEKSQSSRRVKHRGRDGWLGRGRGDEGSRGSRWVVSRSRDTIPPFVICKSSRRAPAGTRARPPKYSTVICFPLYVVLLPVYRVDIPDSERGEGSRRISSSKI